MAKKKPGFWAKVDDLIDSLPEYINGEINTVGKNNIVINGSNSVTQSSTFGSSVSTITQGGKKIVIKTKNGKTTVTVNGNEYVPKEKNE